MRAVLRDIYTDLKGLYNKQTQAIPNGIYMYMDGQPEAAGSNSIRVTMKLPLSGPAVEGNTRMVGTEEVPQTKTATFYRNNWGHAVSTEKYGVRKLDQEYLGIYEQHVDDQGVWARQYRGRSIRTSFLERHSPNLLVGDTAQLATAEWNPHFFIGGLSFRDQPVYSSNMVTYTNNIVGGIQTASGGDLTSQLISNSLNIRAINNLARYAQDNLIWPLTIAGNQAYILTVSKLQATVMSDPTWSANTLGARYREVDKLPEKYQKWNGLIGMLRCPAGVDIWIVVDAKQPTLVPGGSAEPFNLTAGYVFEGDDRTPLQLNNARVRDTAFLLGQAAIAGWEPEKMHMVEQDEEYHRIYGDGVKGVWGYSLPIFDQVNPVVTPSTREYYGGVVAVFSRPEYL
jgi:hypothetical protein